MDHMFIYLPVIKRGWRDLQGIERAGLWRMPTLSVWAWLCASRKWIGGWRNCWKMKEGGGKW
jgi:hypothetical protein